MQTYADAMQTLAAILCVSAIILACAGGLLHTYEPRLPGSGKRPRTALTRDLARQYHERRAMLRQARKLFKLIAASYLCLATGAALCGIYILSSGLT